MTELEKLKEKIKKLSLAELRQWIIREALRIGAIKISSIKPFLWASGYQMPIYNDNRLHLSNPESRTLIVFGLMRMIELMGMDFDFIEGTAMAGIPWATLVSHELFVSNGYIRDKAKDHGLRNRIEGLPSDKDFEGKGVIVVEDLISTGGSSATAVQAVIDAHGDVKKCISIFDYGFQVARDCFSKLTPPCTTDSLITYPMLLDEALKVKYLKEEEVILLQDWSNDPFNWGAKHGFPQIVK